MVLDPLVVCDLENNCIFAVTKQIDMDGVSLQVHLPDYGKYEPAELTRILTQIALRLIGKETQIDNTVSFPCVYSDEEAKVMAIHRGRDIKSGRAKLIPHDDVMKEIEQLITSYAD